eukprot:gnl/Trimastix_PCT/3209.p1 GENE.gnl/Trimastix_PCT/3209~~gnl/Trimastix_PCT/3209.p1  ORF type:complete len:447 (-),score=138.75 gnl/Trimastix_PCT/3209:21-1361(-)
MREYLTADEVKFTKPRKKKRLRKKMTSALSEDTSTATSTHLPTAGGPVPLPQDTKPRVKTEQDDDMGMDVEEESAFRTVVTQDSDHRSRASRSAAALAGEQTAARLAERRARYDRAFQMGAVAQPGTMEAHDLARAKTKKTDSQPILDEEDDAFLQRVERATAKREPDSIGAKAIVQQVSQTRVKQEPTDEPAATLTAVNLDSKIFSRATEFARAIPTMPFYVNQPPPASTASTAPIAPEVARELDEENQMMASLAQPKQVPKSAEWVDASDLGDDLDTDDQNTDERRAIQIALEEERKQEAIERRKREAEEDLHELDLFADEPVQQRGLAAALALCKTRGMLGDDDTYGRTKDKRVDVNHVGDDFRIEYIDKRTGRAMAPKEAFRYMSHRFHNKFPSKNRQEKEHRKILKEMHLKRVQATVAPPSLQALQKVQQQAHTPFLALDD